MQPLRKGRYEARTAAQSAEVEAAQALRHLCFFPGQGPGRDADDLDGRYDHMLICDHGSGELVACYRFLVLPSVARITESYSAQFYDLSALAGRKSAGLEGPVVEMGRFCRHPDWQDADILRLAWAAMTRIVDLAGAGLLFGCSSFAGTDPARFRDSLAVLAERHLAPPDLAPKATAPDHYAFARLLRDHVPDRAKGMQQMPPLLRSYLMMGGWVSEQAVIDRQMGTHHVFTGLQIAAIPAGRSRLLRALAEG
ncbi:MAG: GNAT family N-acyltransferase [Pseudorhodobacter sp.]|nr:GNAT family N-acyltransferase [Pseudorhodobacter sp.]